MKRVKKNAASFKSLSATQMGKTRGGQWVEVTNPDGTTTTVWL
jgi:hypothetical protein